MKIVYDHGRNVRPRLGKNYGRIAVKITAVRLMMTFSCFQCLVHVSLALMAIIMAVIMAVRANFGRKNS